MRGREGAYRIRVGDYRIIYEIHATEIVVYIVGVAQRREVYRQILKRRCTSFLAFVSPGSLRPLRPEPAEAGAEIFAIQLGDVRQ